MVFSDGDDALPALCCAVDTLLMVPTLSSVAAMATVSLKDRMWGCGNRLRC